MLGLLNTVEVAAALSPLPLALIGLPIPPLSGPCLPHAATSVRVCRGCKYLSGERRVHHTRRCWCVGGWEDVGGVRKGDLTGQLELEAREERQLADRLVRGP